MESILQSAADLIVERGLDGLQMRELSKHANVPIGTLYQFFNDREAILACLASRYLSWQDEELTQRFQNIDSIQGWLDAIEGATEVFYKRNLKEPAIAELWRAASTSNAVREIDNASTIQHTQLLFDMARPHFPARVSDEELEITCRMVCELAATAIQRALQLPEKKGGVYIQQFEAMVRARLAEMMAD